MKAGLIAPLYLSVSWVLTVTYQLLTQTAVSAIGFQVGSIWPSAASWINSNIETIIFIYAFTWIFVLSSVIPTAIVGKGRGVLAQYLVVLTLSLVAFFMPDILFAAFGIQIGEIVSSAVILQNPLIAIFYLSAPYLFMIAMDLRSRTITKRMKIQETIIKNDQLSDERLHKLLSLGNAESPNKRNDT